MATLAKGADLGPSSSTIVANPSDVLAANLGPATDGRGSAGSLRRMAATRLLYASTACVFLSQKEKGGPQVPSTPDRIPLGAVTRLGKEAKD